MSVESNDVIRVTARMNHAGISAVQNQYHFQYRGVSPAGDAVVEAAVAGRLDAAYTFLIPYQETNFVYSDIQVWNVTQDRPMVTQSWPTLTLGTGNGAMLPLQVALLVLFRTPVARSQGRKYLPPSILATSIGGGLFSQAYIDAAFDWADELVASVPATPGSLAIGNYRYPAEGVPARFADWINFTVGQYARTQRRRVFGVGQ